MDTVLGIIVIGLWLFAIIACTDLAWNFRSTRAAMLFMLTAEYRLNAFVEELEGRIAARRNG